MKYKTASSILGLSALVSLSIILVCGCGRKEVKEKTALELRNIDSIAVLYTSAPKDTFKLSPVQITQFVTAWNKASNARLLITQAELQLIVKEESGTERHFRVGNNRIKEDDDWAFTATEDLFQKMLTRLNLDNALELRNEQVSHTESVSFIDLCIASLWLNQKAHSYY